MTTKDKIQFVLTRSLGNFLVILALYGVLATFGPVVAQEARFRIDMAKGVRYVIADSNQLSAKRDVSATQSAGLQYSTVSAKASVSAVSSVSAKFVTPAPPDLLGSLFSTNKERILIPSDTLFSILIPKIGASAKVVPNVDPTNEVQFHEALLTGVAHAKGSVFPGFAGNTYLFAHSTDTWWNVGRYNAVFYLLKDLQRGDDIVIFFESRRYNYSVIDTVVADASDVSFLTNPQRKEERLILQTCYPPGTTWKRLFIVAKPKEKSI